MRNIEKKVQINQNRLLTFKVHNSLSPICNISETILDNGVLQKAYTLSKWGDINFNCFTNNSDGSNSVSFVFDSIHPLYGPLINLLGADDSLVIHEDDTRAFNKKYVLIKKMEDRIEICFVNDLDNADQMSSMEKFHVFVKNNSRNYKTRIDSEVKSLDDRLSMFFQDAYNALSNTNLVRFTVTSFERSRKLPKEVIGKS